MGTIVISYNWSVIGADGHYGVFQYQTGPGLFDAHTAVLLGPRNFDIPLPLFVVAGLVFLAIVSFGLCARMNFTRLPKTKSAWGQTCFHCLLIAGFWLLSVQVWARLALSGFERQDIEEMLSPLPLILGSGLVVCSVIALFRRQRLLGLMTMVIGVLSALIAFLPILLNEGIRD
jgi:hypothetical protein